MTTRTTAEGFARENSLLRHALKAVVVLILAVLSLPGVIPIAFGFLLQSCFRRPLPNLLMTTLGAALAWLTWTLWHWSPVTIVISMASPRPRCPWLSAACSPPSAPTFASNGGSGGRALPLP